MIKRKTNTPDPLQVFQNYDLMQCDLMLDLSIGLTKQNSGAFVFAVGYGDVAFRYPGDRESVLIA